MDNNDVDVGDIDATREEYTLQYLGGGADTLASKVTRCPCFDTLDKQLIKIAVP